MPPTPADLDAAKIAPTDYPIHELLSRRWSPRAFAERPVEREKLLSLLEAARWSASSSNMQPWHFVVVSRHEQPEAFQRLLDCLMPGNQIWAQHAPVLMLSVANLEGRRGRENSYALHDVGLAVQNLIVQATALDLHAHQMAGFDKEAARQAFHIPDTHQPVTVTAIGYLGDPKNLTDELRERELAPRERRPLRDYVYGGAWGEPSPLLTE